MLDLFVKGKMVEESWYYCWFEKCWERDYLCWVIWDCGFGLLLYCWREGFWSWGDGFVIFMEFFDECGGFNIVVGSVRWFICICMGRNVCCIGKL